MAKLNAAGSALVYSTYLGGSGDDVGLGIALDGSGSAYVTGSTQSTDFPTVTPTQATFGGFQDAFVAKLNAAGSAFVYSTYLGGSAVDFGFAIAVDASGSAVVTGFTSSTDFPTANPLQASYGGSGDALVAKITHPLPGANFFTVAPCRVADTRGGAPICGPVMQGQQTRVFAMAGICGIPSTAKALSLYATVTQPTAVGNVRFFPAGQTPPTVSSLNYSAGQTRGNNAVVALDPSGAMAAFVGQAAGTTVHLIIDVNGYFE